MPKSYQCITAEQKLKLQKYKSIRMFFIRFISEKLRFTEALYLKTIEASMTLMFV